jgi:hypothetical protein
MIIWYRRTARMTHMLCDANGIQLYDIGHSIAFLVPNTASSNSFYNPDVRQRRWNDWGKFGKLGQVLEQTKNSML